MRNFGVLITGCILMMLFASKTAAQTVASGTTGECVWTITGDTAGFTLTVSGEGRMGEYNSFTDVPWYDYDDDITTLDIQEGVTTVANYAFSGCSDLTSITIPNSVMTIGDWAFSSCRGLTSITIPNSVITIGAGAFFYCRGLTSVTIPHSVTTIGRAAFVFCRNLTTIAVDSGNPNYSSINGVLFNKLQDILIQYPAAKIGSYTIPLSVMSIDGVTFSGCNGLTGIEVDAGNPNYSSIDGVLFNKLQDTLIQYPAGKTGSYTIPNSVTSIGYYAFSECRGLTSVTIDNSVTTIGNFAFYDCRGLTSITIKATTPPYIDEDTFVEVSRNIPLYVPCGALEDYKQSDWGAYFNNIIEDCGGATGK